MERSEFEAMLDSKLSPLYQTIKRLEESQEKIVDILQIQAKHGSDLGHYKNNFDKMEAANIREHEEMFERLRAVEKDSGDKVWDVLKMFLVALVAGVVGRFSK